MSKNHGRRHKMSLGERVLRHLDSFLGERDEVIFPPEDRITCEEYWELRPRIMKLLSSASKKRIRS